ncbi:hypothetical protein GP2_064_00010 [Gordonia paraffinivorans NBRC 108238]|uniref:Secreted protein n=1 Tax=Gordonia paraffinivorans NBRC 108238 TaxID=1223543 RepID=A0ABQ0ITR3_9ACTN|nr:hypothetical protein GP2_064_00010 [Gordonia paraffinivorans NBRC 108238]
MSRINLACLIFFGVIFGGRPPDPTASPGCGEAGRGAFADEVAFELGERAEDGEDQLAAGGGGVDRFGHRPEADAALFEVGDDLKQMWQ